MSLIRSRFSKRCCPENYTSTNFLAREVQLHTQIAFYDSEEGPVPHHDNDHAQFELIAILPTTDEILAAYKPVYQPKKSHGSPNPYPVGELRHLDLMFRQMRHENVQPIKDICYNAAQIAFVFRPPTHAINPLSRAGDLPLMLNNIPQNEVVRDVNNIIRNLRSSTLQASLGSEVRETPMGNRFYLYREVQVEQLVAHEQNAIMVRLSFGCPEYLRGRSLYKGTRFQNGMMLALLCHNNITHELHVYYFNVHLRQSTMSMDSRGGNGQRAAVLCALIPESTRDDILELARYSQGLDPGMEFCLVEFPRLMHHGFYHCLSRLQQISAEPGLGGIAFTTYVAPSRSEEEVRKAKLQFKNTRIHSIQAVQPPEYAQKPGFVFDLSSVMEGGQTSFTVQELLALPSLTSEALDDEQSRALRHCLTNEFCFVQGPPGTGKTYLGLQLAQILLASRVAKPILVVCLTNHALDNFLSGLVDAGVKGIIRVGSGSKEEWTESLNLRVKARKARNSPRENATKSSAARMRKSAFASILEWCGNVSAPTLARAASPWSSSSSGDVDPTTESHNDGHKSDGILAASFGSYGTSDPELAAENLAEDVVRYNEANKMTKMVRENVDARVLSEASIIGLTTTACANRWDVLRRVGIQIVIFEEAAEVMEPHALCALLPSVKHAISIGDPKQLRPEVSDQLLTMERHREYRLDESLFERMVEPSDQSALRLCYERLGLQRRMHPEIANISRLIYPFLRDHDSTKNHDPTFGIKERVFWWDHDAPEREATEDNKSHINDHEVAMVTALVQYLVENSGYSQGDIAVLTPYTGQLAVLHQALSLTCRVWLDDRDREKLLDEEQLKDDNGATRGKEEVVMEDMLRVTTVDNFQGEEAKVVIISTVRSGDKAGFLSIKNRVTVACSRARDGFYIVGNSRTLAQVQLWDEVLKVLGSKRRGFEIVAQCGNHPDHSSTIRNPQDFPLLPDCPVKCEETLKCGHRCNRKCHPKSLHERGALPCEHPCEKKLKCGHRCTLSCGVDCGDCLKAVRTVNLPCGHSGALVCSGGTLTCSTVIGSKSLPCGHVRKLTCGEKGRDRGRPQVCEACRLEDEGESSSSSNSLLYGGAKLDSVSAESMLEDKVSSGQTLRGGLDEDKFIEAMELRLQQNREDASKAGIVRDDIAETNQTDNEGKDEAGNVEIGNGGEEKVGHLVSRVDEGMEGQEVMESTEQSKVDKTNPESSARVVTTDIGGAIVQTRSVSEPDGPIKQGSRLEDDCANEFIQAIMEMNRGLRAVPSN